MSFSPSSGSYAKPFTVNLMIDGQGEKFNAAQATVTVPDNLKVQEINLGDCHFSFLTTPTMEDPSFEGVILSSYSEKCTAYSLKVAPIKKGEASLAIAKGSVKRYGDAVEILSSKQGGKYTITGVSKDAAILGEQTKSQKEGMYTVNIKVSSESKPVENLEVTLKTVEKKDGKETKTDKSGTATFADLKEGIYDVVIEQDNKKVGESIVNVKGKSPVLTLGINLDMQADNPLMKGNNSLLETLAANPLFLVAALVIGMVVGISIVVFIGKLKGKKKQD